MWEAIGGSSVAELDEADPAYRRWVVQMQKARRLVAWIAEDRDGTPVGSGAVWLTEAQPRPTELARWRPYILSMYTEPAHRGQGIASAIVRAAVDYAKERKFGRITLHAAPMGRHVYERVGFERSWEMRMRFGRSAPRRRHRGSRRRR